MKYASAKKHRIWTILILFVSLLTNLLIVPIQTASATTTIHSVQAFAAGERHSLALKNDGTVWVWGGNAYGQLGNGTTTDQTVPIKVQGLSDVIAISARAYSSFALQSDGTVWAWGENGGGSLGDGSTTNRLTPVKVLSNVSAIVAGHYHTLALKSDGTVWAWGRNTYGQLGDGSTTDRLLPVVVTGLTHVKKLSAGHHFSLALKSDGTVWAWGNNNYGQLGDGTGIKKSTPIQVNGVTNAIDLSVGISHALALLRDGTVSSWGYNTTGQLGDGTLTNRLSPVKVSGLSNVTKLSTGGFWNFSMAIKSDGTLWGWGDNQYGNLGNGSNTSATLPVQAKGIQNAISFTGGSYHSLVLLQDGTVWATGRNIRGALGNGTTTDSNVFVRVANIGRLTLTAESSSPTTVDLSYSASYNVTKFVVKRDTTILPCPETGTNLTCQDTELTPGTSYDYTLETYGTGGLLLDTTSVTVKPDVVPAPFITLTADQVEVPVGSTVSIYVVIDNAVDLYAEDLTVKFNPALLTFIGAEPAGTGLKIYHQNASTPGMLRFIVASQGAQYGVSNTAQLLKLTFQTKNVAGTDILAISDGLVADSKGNEIIPIFGNVTLTIIGVNGDVNDDGRVSLGDLALAGYHFGMDSASWTHPKADVNKNNAVEDLDLARIVEEILL